MKYPETWSQQDQKRPRRHYRMSKRTTFLLLVAIALTLWGPVEMAARWTFHPEFIATMIAGLVAIAYLTWSTMYLTGDTRPPRRTSQRGGR